MCFQNTTFLRYRTLSEPISVAVVVVVVVCHYARDVRLIALAAKREKRTERSSLVLVARSDRGSDPACVVGIERVALSSLEAKGYWQKD